MINSPCNLLSWSLFFIPRGTSPFYYEVTAEFHSQDCADFSPDWLLTASFRSGSNTSWALFSLSWLLFPVILCVDFHFSVPPMGSIFSIYSFISPGTIHVPSTTGKAHPAHPKPWVVEHTSLLLVLPSPRSSSQEEFGWSHISCAALSRQFAAVRELMDMGALLVTFLSNNWCNSKGRALPAGQRFNYQLCCCSAQLPWAPCCQLVF